MSVDAKKAGTIIATIVIPIVSALLLAFFALGDMKWVTRDALASVEKVQIVHAEKLIENKLQHEAFSCSIAEEKKERKEAIAKVRQKHKEDLEAVKPALMRANIKLDLMMEALRIEQTKGTKK